jgi:acyl-coenzyme A synthetase/AMP-(fatty) acid ligase
MWGLETSILLPLVAPLAVASRTPFYPQNIVEIANELPSPVLLVSSPIHLEALLNSGLKPTRLDRIWTATALLTKELARQLEARFDARVQDVFGCSESGILATRNTATEELWTYPTYFRLQVSNQGAKISADHLPESVMMPDIIELVGNNQYRWIGRPSDMVNIGGKRGSLADLNEQLRAISGVVDAVVFRRTVAHNRLAALVVAPQLEVGEIRRQLALKVDPVFLPRPILKVEALPRQETGKLAVNAVREIFEEQLTLKRD